MPTRAGQGFRFGQQPSVGLPRSVFDRSHGWKGTFLAGLLIPFFIDNILPGDTCRVKTNLFIRLATFVKPIMDNIYVDTFFFFVPYRLLWTNWKKFMGEQDNPGDSISFTVPQVTDAGQALSQVGTWLGDAFGFPCVTDVSAQYSVSAMPFRAYIRIWNEWFRDENLQGSLTMKVNDGPDTGADGGAMTYLSRGKRADYFTSCLPSPQKGTAVPILPTTGKATVNMNATALIASPANPLLLANAGTGAQLAAAKSLSGNAAGQLTWNDTVPGANPVAAFPSNLYADMGTLAATATINALRIAYQQQKFLERDNRGGTRYIELIYSHWRVRSSDARLQRPEYLGGGTSRINFAPVASTSSVPAQTVPQGNLAGVGTGAITGHGFARSFEEHGIVMGLLDVRLDINYAQGLERCWSYLTRFDFPWPEFMHLGEQAVLNKELYLRGDGNDPLTFGYQARYDECRYKPSRITGAFRSTYGTPIDYWHVAQKFTSLPALNPTFITEPQLPSRVKAVVGEIDFLCDAWVDYKHARIMPTYSVPGFSDHF